LNTSRRTIVFAVALAATMSLFPAACNKPTGGAEATASEKAPPAPAPAAAPVGRLVPISVTSDGYSPKTIEAKKGETLTLRFTRTTKSECLKAVTIPDLKIEKDLPMDTPVDITITPDKEGKMVFQCWMAMVKGEINVSGS
jgi:plastocyanin domain-containing protein